MTALGGIRQDAKLVFVAMLIMGCLMGFVAIPVLVYSPKETDPSRLEPVKHPMKLDEFGKADLTPARLAALIPYVRRGACIFSENAVRHYLRPAQVEFKPCAPQGPQVTIAENLIDITVSGVATVENAERPFVVTLQHNPPSVTEDGLIITAIKVD